MTYGDIPSPRADAVALSLLDPCVKPVDGATSMKSIAIVIGGLNRSRINARDGYLYDIHTLDMDSMTWRAIKGSEQLVQEGMWPQFRRYHSFTQISRDYAVLYGGHGGPSGSGHLGDCWLLDLQKCISEMSAENIWTVCKTVSGNKRSHHAAIMEPTSKSLWIVGGTTNESWDTAVHTLEMSFNANKTLQDLAVASAAKNISKLRSKIDKLPNTIQLAIEREVQRERNQRSWLKTITMQEN